MDESKEEAMTMDLWGHIGEMRARLLKALIALIVTTLASFALAERNHPHPGSADWRVG